MQRLLLAIGIILVVCAANPVVAQDGDTKLTAPVWIENDPVPWPETAGDVEEIVIVTAVVYLNRKGRVVNVEVLDGPDPDPHLFVAVAEGWLWGQTFEPARNGRKKAKARFQMQVTFIPPDGTFVQAGVPGEKDESWLDESPDLEPDQAELLNAVDEDSVAEGVEFPDTTNTVRGQLLERGTRQPLIGGQVSAVQGDIEYSTWTDADGRFELQLSTGTWSFMATVSGEPPFETEETLDEHELLDVTWYLERQRYDGLGGSANYVYETRESKRQRKEVSRRRLSANEVVNMAGAQGDALKAIRSLPGVATVANFDAATVIRGSEPGDSQVVLDDGPIPIAYHFAALASVVNADILDAIDFLPGNFSVRYGRALGGVIALQTRPIRDRFSGYVNLDLAYSALLLEAPIVDGLAVQVAARRSYFDLVAPLILGSDAGQFDLTILPTYWDYQGRVAYEPSKTHQLELLVYGSDDTVEFEREPNPAAPRERGEFHLFNRFHKGQLRWTAKTKTLRNVVTYNVGSSLEDQQDGLAQALRTEVLQHSLREELSVVSNERATFTIGVDAIWQDYEVAYSIPDPALADGFPGGFEADTNLEGVASDDVLLPGFFLEGHLRPSAFLDLVLGARLDHDPDVDSWYADLRANARVHVAEGLALIAGIGVFSQPPELFERASVVDASPLDWEHALHTSLGAHWVMAFYAPLSLSLTGFHKEFWSLVVPSSQTVEGGDGALVSERFSNDGSGRALGLEVLLGHAPAHAVSGWVAYTLSRSTRNDADGQSILFDYDQTHLLTVVFSVDLPDHWRIGSRFRFATGRPFTPVEDAAYDADRDVFAPIFGLPNSARIDAFHQLDLRVDKQFVFDWWILTVYLDLQSIYLQANAVAPTYNHDYTEQSFFRFIPIIPTLGIRGSW